MLRICTTVAIAAPPSVVWADVERLETHPEWMRDAVRIDFVGPARRGVGTEAVCLTRVGPLRTHDRMRVTAWEPGTRLAIEHVGAVRGTGELALTVHGSGTTVTWTERLRFPWWLAGGVGARAARPLLARIWRGNLERLRTRVESRQ